MTKPRDQKEQDRKALAALEEATRQYEQYLELTEVVRVLKESQQEPRLPVTTWSSPLDLTFNRR